jgi:mono/diheme cytochrome c family protein
MRRAILALLVAAGLGILVAVGSRLEHILKTGNSHFADADNAVTVVHGKSIYRSRCASCHGRNLQGQSLWQLKDEYADRRAPAHDETGHTWQHSDEELFHIVKYGRFSETPVDEVSFMPAFRQVLDDRDIIAVTAFIKSRWPTALRVSQAILNPGHAGMPLRADETEWKFPPVNCSAERRRQAAAGITPAVPVGRGEKSR